MALYGITPRTADRLRQILADGGSVGGAPSSGATARGVTWVKVTGTADGDGWYPGVVSLDVAGAWSDLTAPVKVATNVGGTLAVGTRYPCTRTGADADGTPRFRTDSPPPLATTTVPGLLDALGHSQTVWVNLTTIGTLTAQLTSTPAQTSTTIGRVQPAGATGSDFVGGFYSESVNPTTATYASVFLYVLPGVGTPHVFCEVFTGGNVGGRTRAASGCFVVDGAGFGVKDGSGGLHLGADGTVSGLTFKGGLYVTGSVSPPSASDVNAILDADGGLTGSIP